MQPEQKVNVLLVDDNPKNLLALEAILDNLDHNLVKAYSGEQALRCLLKQDFAVILLDVQMPGIDGFETARLIRERDKTRHTPIIFFTAFSKSDTLMFKGYSLGAVDYLLKPIEQEILTSKVAVFVELFRKTAEVKRQTVQLQAVNAELRKSEERFRSLSACSPVGIFLTDVEGNYTYMNPLCQSICGFTLEESDTEGWLRSVHPEDRERVKADWSAWTQKDREYSNEFRLQTQAGIVLWVHIRSSLMVSAQGEIIGHVGTIEDITERKQAESALYKANNKLEIRVQERTAELIRINESLQAEIAERKRVEQALRESNQLFQASLMEKEVLLKEIHHRVKNNLQIISSLLNLQSEYIQDKQDLDIFKVSQNRIESMALIHEKLYQCKDLAQIEFAEYIQDLIANLFCSYEVNSNAISLNINIDNIFLGIDVAIPCGLMLNELILNCLKHAFPSGRAGEIRIDLSSNNENQYTLIVSDNGIGFPQDLDFQNTDSLGLQLVNALTNQLGGTIELNRKVGAEFKITFPG